MKPYFFAFYLHDLYKLKHLGHQDALSARDSKSYVSESISEEAEVAEDELKF